MRVLVTGGAGQVGSALTEALADVADVISHDRASLDLADPAQLVQRVREAQPDVVVNAAAYTAVDRAEEDAGTALTVNAVAPGLLARECRERGALLVHYSTDYVFDGAKAGPYVETDAVAPLNAYGRTKLQGEQAIARSGCPHVILRTSWVYGPRGGNFLLTMLRAGATRDELRVVDDQRGAPTSSLQLARLTRELLALGRPRLEASPGIYHATAAGETTWFGFAKAIFESRDKRPRLVPIPTSAWPTPARRPANSVLSSEKLAATFGVRIAPWREGLAEVLERLPRG
jgi:dTDP-4-dehydrorhamnose reductase